MKRLLIILGLGLTMLLPAAVPATAYNPLSTACQNLSSAQQASSACNDASSQDPTKDPVVDTIAKATRVISMIIGIASVFLIVTSGLTLITSGGNADAVKSAKSRLIGAVVGIVVASLAWLLTTFVVNKLL